MVFHYGLVIVGTVNFGREKVPALCKFRPERKTVRTETFKMSSA